MASLLNRTTLPLWVWVVVIVVGTLMVVGTIAVVTRVVVVRRRQAHFVDTFGDEDLPQRKVTVRRGRVVEQSRYLSLTGSRFGLGAFTSDDNDANSRAGARSKSPFEWWSTVASKDRSQSRNSQLSTTNDAPSLYGLPSSPRQHRFYQRKDLNQSNTSLASTNKEDCMSIIVTETTTPAVPPTVVRNFSRSFARPAPYSKYSPRQHTLSCIEESSPHTSMISTRQSRITSLMNNKRDAKSSTPSPVADSPALSSSFPEPSRWSTMNASKASSIYHEAQDEVTTALPTPPPTTHQPPRLSFGELTPRLSHASSRPSHGDRPRDFQLQPNMITALPEQPNSPQSNNYWETRKDLHPVRTTSKKGKVLRKKSLKEWNCRQVRIHNLHGYQQINDNFLRFCPRLLIR